MCTSLLLKSYTIQNCKNKTHYHFEIGYLRNFNLYLTSSTVGIYSIQLSWLYGPLPSKCDRNLRTFTKVETEQINLCTAFLHVYKKIETWLKITYCIEKVRKYT